MSALVRPLRVLYDVQTMGPLDSLSLMWTCKVLHYPLSDIQTMQFSTLSWNVGFCDFIH